MENNTTEKTKLKPEDMPEYKDDKLALKLIESWRCRFPDWTDERIIEELEFVL